MIENILPTLESFKNKGSTFEVLATDIFRNTLRKDSYQPAIQYKQNQRQRIFIRAFQDNKVGLACTDDSSPSGLDKCLNDALAKGCLSDHPISPIQKAIFENSDRLFDKATINATSEAKAQIVERLFNAAKSFDETIKEIPNASYEDHLITRFYYNSNNVYLKFKKTFCFLKLTAIASQKDHSHSFQKIHLEKDFDHIDPETFAHDICSTAILKLGATKPKTGFYKVLIQSHAALELFEELPFMFTCENAVNVQSKINELISSPILNITDNPFLLSGYYSRPFDFEGNKSQVVPLVKNGVLQRLLCDSYWAKKLNIQNCSHSYFDLSNRRMIAPSNFYIEPGVHSKEFLINKAPTLIEIDRIINKEVQDNGDFICAGEGFIYKSGKLIAPLKDFILKGNYLTALENLEAIASDTNYGFSHLVSPSLLFSKLEVQGE